MGVWQAGTAEDLLEDARRAGYPASKRLLTDWTSLGLLDSPTRRGAGQGKGSTKGVYSAHQRELFSVELEQRSKSTRVAHLASIPIGVWIYYGDEWVPYRQFERVLHTWIERTQSVTLGHSRLGTVPLISQLTHPDSSDLARRRLREMFDNANLSGAIPDASKLKRVVNDVFDPHRTGRKLGPPGARVDATSIVDAALHRCTALQALRSNAVAREQFEWARSELQESLREYSSRQVEFFFNSTSSVRGLFASPVHQHALNNSAQDLLLVLGHQLDPRGST